MSFTFSPTTDRGKVRLLLHDTTDGTYQTDYEFSDADIDALLEQNSDDVWLAAADGCRVMASKSTPSAISLTIPGALGLDKKKPAQIWLELAKRYEMRASGILGDGSILGTATEYWDSVLTGHSTTGADETEYIGDI